METSKENREPRHSWITLAGATVVMFLLIGYTRCNGLVYIELLDMFNEGPVKTSLFQTFFSITVAVAGPIMGYVSDRVSAHWIVVTAGLTAAVSCIGASFAPNLIIITVTYGAIMGWCNSSLFCNCLAPVNACFKENLGLANGIVFTGGAIGEITMPLIVQQLNKTYTVRGTFLIQGGLLLHVIAFGILLGNRETDKSPKNNKCCGVKTPSRLKNCFKDIDGEAPGGSNTRNIISISYISFKDEKSRSDCGLEPSESATAESRLSKKHEEVYSNTSKYASCKALLSLQYLCLAIITFFSCVAWMGITVFVPAYMEDTGYSSSHISIILTLIGVGGLLANPFFGYIADLNVLNRRVAIAIGFAIMSAAALPLSLVTVFPVLCVCCTLLGIFSSISQVNIAPLMSQAIGTNNLAFGIGTTSLIFGIGSALTSLIFSGFKETTGSYSPGFHLAGACYGISSLAAVVSRIHWSTIKKRHNK